MARIVLPVQHVPQRRIGECLAACSAMVLNFLGMPIAYDRLLRVLGIQPGVGVASSKIRNLERVGVRVIYEQGTIEELCSYLSGGVPCIAFVQTRELPYRNDDASHAVVLVGFDDQYIYVDDPEYDNSPLRVLMGDFDLAWLYHDEKYAVITR